MFTDTIQQLITTTGQAHIPRASGWANTFNEGVYITELTADRVIGYEIDDRKEDFRANFNVKHDGVKFFRGSDSSKKSYYLKNVGKEYRHLHDVAFMQFDCPTRTATYTFYAQDVTSVQALTLLRKLTASGITECYAPHVGDYPRVAGETIQGDWVVTNKIVDKMYSFVL